MKKILKLSLLASVLGAGTLLSANSLAGDSGFYTKLSGTHASLYNKKYTQNVAPGAELYARRKKNSPIYGVGFGGNMGNGFSIELMFYKTTMREINEVNGSNINGTLGAVVGTPTTVITPTTDTATPPVTTTTTIVTQNILVNPERIITYNPLSTNATIPMLNLYYDLFRFGPISPYIVVGVGMSRQALKGSTTTGVRTISQTVTSGITNATPPVITGPTSNPATPSSACSNDSTCPSTNLLTSFKYKKASIAYSFGIGLNVMASQSFDIDISYKIMALGKMRTQTATGSPLNVAKTKYHAFEVGMRYWF